MKFEYRSSTTFECRVTRVNEYRIFIQSLYVLRIKSVKFELENYKYFSKSVENTWKWLITNKEKVTLQLDRRSKHAFVTSPRRETQLLSQHDITYVWRMTYNSF